MRRSASEIIRNLEMRVARLERQANSNRSSSEKDQVEVARLYVEEKTGLNLKRATYKVKTKKQREEELDEGLKRKKRIMRFLEPTDYDVALGSIINITFEKGFMKVNYNPITDEIVVSLVDEKLDRISSVLRSGKYNDEMIEDLTNRNEQILDIEVEGAYAKIQEYKDTIPFKNDGLKMMVLVPVVLTIGLKDGLDPWRSGWYREHGKVETVERKEKCAFVADSKGNLTYLGDFTPARKGIGKKLGLHTHKLPKDVKTGIRLR